MTELICELQFNKAVDSANNYHEFDEYVEMTTRKSAGWRFYFTVSLENDLYTRKCSKIRQIEPKDIDFWDLT